MRGELPLLFCFEPESLLNKRIPGQYELRAWRCKDNPQRWQIRSMPTLLCSEAHDDCEDYNHTHFVPEKVAADLGLDELDVTALGVPQLVSKPNEDAEARRRQFPNIGIDEQIVLAGKLMDAKAASKVLKSKTQITLNLRHIFQWSAATNHPQEWAACGGVLPVPWYRKYHKTMTNYFRIGNKAALGGAEEEAIVDRDDADDVDEDEYVPQTAEERRKKEAQELAKVGSLMQMLLEHVPDIRELAGDLEAFLDHFDAPNLREMYVVRAYQRESRMSHVVVLNKHVLQTLCIEYGDIVVLDDTAEKLVWPQTNVFTLVAALPTCTALPLGHLICVNQAADDIGYLLRQIKNTLLPRSMEHFATTVLIDGDRAEFNALTEHFRHCKIVLCYWHVQKVFQNCKLRNDAGLDGEALEDAHKKVLSCASMSSAAEIESVFADQNVKLLLGERRHKFYSRNIDLWTLVDPNRAFTANRRSSQLAESSFGSLRSATVEYKTLKQLAEWIVTNDVRRSQSFIDAVKHPRRPAALPPVCGFGSL